MSFAEFTKTVPDFEQLSSPPTQLIPYFAYFLDSQEEGRVMHPKEFGLLFDEACVRRPGNLSASMSASKSFVKAKGGGYRLERHARERMKGTLSPPSGRQSKAPPPASQGISHNGVGRDSVFVVYGRDLRLRQDFFNLLRAMGLNPLEFEAMSHLTGSTSPSTWEVIQAGFAHAQACVVLFSPDELVKLREDLQNDDDSDDQEFQPRPNVLLEAGMALATQPTRTIIVKIGKVRNVSDLDGIQYVSLTGSAESRNKLLSKLKLAGCDARTHGDDWLSVGQFKIDARGGRS